MFQNTSCRIINISLPRPNLSVSPLDLSVFPPQLCMLCSVGYHLFCCHRSEKTSRRWMALDYAGVSIGILGCYVPGVFYTFYCNNVSSLGVGSQVFGGSTTQKNVSCVHFFFSFMIIGVKQQPLWLH